MPRSTDCGLAEEPNRRDTTLHVFPCYRDCTQRATQPVSATPEDALWSAHKDRCRYPARSGWREPLRRGRGGHPGGLAHLDRSTASSSARAYDGDRWWCHRGCHGLARCAEGLSRAGKKAFAHDRQTIRRDIAEGTSGTLQADSGKGLEARVVLVLQTLWNRQRG